MIQQVQVARSVEGAEPLAEEPQQQQESVAQSFAWAEAREEDGGQLPMGSKLTQVFVALRHASKSTDFGQEVSGSSQREMIAEP